MSTRTIKHLKDQEAANSIAILKSGWLTKKGAKVKNWKRRYCVLVEDRAGDSAELFYYPSQEENKPPAGAVELEHGGSAALTTVAGKVHVFQIVTKDRVWVMYADSAKDAEGWVKQLTTTIAAIPQPGKKRQCEDCGINDAESKISVKGRLTGLCKPCCVKALAAAEDKDEADDRVLICDLCKFKFRSQELLDRHQSDWHKCSDCGKLGRTEAVAGGDGFVRKCFDCTIKDGAEDDNNNNKNNNDDEES